MENGEKHPDTKYHRGGARPMENCARVTRVFFAGVNKKNASTANRQTAYC